MPAHVAVLLLAYLAVVVTGFLRAASDASWVDYEGGVASVWSEYLVNTLKWVIPGILLFDGARSRERFLLGLACSLGIYALLSVQVIKWMPLASLGGGDALTARSLKILSKEVGYHRVNMSMMLAGGAWAIFAAHALAKRWLVRMAILFTALGTTFAQALTGGRMGYVTWLALAVMLCTLKWRRYLLLAPVAVLGIVLFVPSAVERMTQGFSADTYDRPGVEVAPSDDDLAAYTVTAGRTLIWPYVIEKIGEAPLLGYGREAMKRTGLAQFLYQELGEEFPHPHNAYLQWLLDNGWVGFVLVMPFYVVVLFHATRLFLDSRSAVFVAAGGATLALVLALLIASAGSQTFYPREGAVGMWCAIGLMLRVSLERRRAIGLAAHAVEVRPASQDPGPRAGSSLLSERARRRRVPPRASLDEFLWTEVA
jgi:O-antigen ligase